MMVRRVLILVALAMSLPAVEAIGGSGSASASQTSVSIQGDSFSTVHGNTRADLSSASAEDLSVNPHAKSGPPSAAYSLCAPEGQTCNVSGVADVAFGANGKFYYKDGVTGSIACTDAVFGDPDYGVVKACYTTPDPNPGPGYSLCAPEGQTCNVTGVADVAFGANGKFYYKDGVTGSIACTDAVFGDPDYGVVKACYTTPDPNPGPGYSLCAPEGQTCNVTGVADVAFGANGKFYYKDGVTGSIACTDAVFGDPDYGVVKACYTTPDPGPAGYSLCAPEGQTCNVSGVADVAFGANGKFYYKDGVTGSIACTDAVFGDPDYGVVKACYTTPDPNPGPGYSLCAPEGQTCNVSGVADVAFGANGKFYYKDGVTGSIACTDAVFGDPDYGVVKACYTTPDPNPGPGYSLCAPEGQTCNVTGVAKVAFGANGKFYYKNGVTGSIACTDAVFGDPDYGVVKACYTTPV